MRCPRQTEARPREGDASPSHPLLEQAELPVREANVTLGSGRRYCIEAGEGSADRLVVRGSDGDVVLAILITDEGPVLRFRSAALELSATEELRLEASRVHVHSTGDLHIDAAGSLLQEAGRDHHLRVGGDHRVEARALEMQASTGHVEVRAMHRIALDGEHIGLNDDPVPRPFSWSSLSEPESSE